MVAKEICPLRSTDANVSRCDSRCAWNVGSDQKPMCAITKISLNLSSIEDQYTNR